MDPSDLIGGETLPPLRLKPRKMKRLQDLRPSPLKLSQDSHKIKIVRPKVYITDPSNFRNLVQQLTGLPSGNFVAEDEISPAAKSAHTEEASPREGNPNTDESDNDQLHKELLPPRQSEFFSPLQKGGFPGDVTMFPNVIPRNLIRRPPAKRIRRAQPQWTEHVRISPETTEGAMPPEDGYVWRKYGEKNILGANFPRKYYRCTHKCLATKQVQRSDKDPSTLEVTYIGRHTCVTARNKSSVSVPERVEDIENQMASRLKFQSEDAEFSMRDEEEITDLKIIKEPSTPEYPDFETFSMRDEEEITDLKIIKEPSTPESSDFESFSMRDEEEITDLKIIKEPSTPEFPDFETEAVDVKMGMQDLASWKLFCQHMGQFAYFSSLQPLAYEVVNLCFDNPDAIRIIAAALKDASDVDIWRKALEMLEMGRQPSSNQEILEKNIMITVLKFSYARLQDDKTRKCLRNCAFLCKNGLIAVELLIQSCLTDGLFVSHDEGKKMLETLIDFNLLASPENDEFLKMENNICGILLEHIVPSEEGGQFLVQGSLGLTVPPKVEEWEKSKEIILTDNKLSELPLSPVCPKLEALFLGRNNKLRKIPPSFFDHMPVLQVLNLSRTNIKSLPESLFKLARLRKLFLNHCDLITSLPPEIGELKELEVLDLAGTEITHLPVEVGQLTKLTCLEVSFFEPISKKRSEKIIPHEVISALTQLEELNFDVSADDRRWNASAEVVVAEISRLQNLNTLKFYFPKGELLSYLNHLNDAEKAFSSLSNFRFIVGHFVDRVISRVPREIEFELERYDRYLKYVNGEGILDGIKKVIRHANALFLDRHSNIGKLSDFGYANMKQLKCCVAGQCNDLEAIIDGNQIENEPSSGAIVGLNSLEYMYICYMKNLRCICEGSISGWSFYMLKSLTLRTCPKLTTIFTQELLANFSNLEELTIHDCPKITTLVNCSNYEDKNFSVFLPALKRISLHFLPNLTSISNGLHISKRLELMSFRHCRNLKSLPITKDFNENVRKIKGESSWWQDLEWQSSEQGSWDDVFVPVD